MVRRFRFAVQGSAPGRRVRRVAESLTVLRDDVGISHDVVRDPERFAPVAAALAGR